MANLQPKPPPQPRGLGARPSMPRPGINGVLTRAQILNLSEQARDGIHLANRNFYRKNPLLPEDSTSLMLLPSDYIEERRLRDEAEQAAILYATQGHPPPAESPKPPPKKAKKQQKSLLKGLKGKRTVSVSLDQAAAPSPPPISRALAARTLPLPMTRRPLAQGRDRAAKAQPRPPPSAGTPSTRLAAALSKGLSVSTPSSIRKPPSGRRSARRVGRGGFFGEDEEDTDPSFHLRNEAAGLPSFRDAGVGGANFCPQSARARASHAGAPRGDLVMRHSALATGAVSWSAPEAERREAERQLHALHAQAAQEALSFAGDLDLWPTWYEQLPYASARKVCRAAVSLQRAARRVAGPLASSGGGEGGEALTEWGVEGAMREGKASTVTGSLREDARRLERLLAEGGGGRDPGLFLCRRGDAGAAEALLAGAREARELFRGLSGSRLVETDTWDRAKVAAPLASLRGQGSRQGPRRLGGVGGVGGLAAAVLGASLSGTVLSARRSKGGGGLGGAGGKASKAPPALGATMGSRASAGAAGGGSAAVTPKRARTSGGELPTIRKGAVPARYLGGEEDGDAPPASPAKRLRMGPEKAGRGVGL